MTPGYKTKTFWLTAAATAVAAFVGSGAANAPWLMQALGAVGAALAAAGYASVRVFQKGGIETAPPWKRTEFWLTLLTATAMLVSAAAMPGSKVAQASAAVIAALGWLGRHAMPPKA